jgi:UDP-GlcNAc3NAcA epimerase
MKILTVVGARPQFIKAAVVSRALRCQPGSREVLLHTGQHYDDNMSGRFFTELDLAEPDYQLGVGSGNHGAQTGKMLAAIEEVLLSEKPDWVLVYGDTNSTLAGALAAAKLHIPLAHVEAGLRSFNRKMPEEINRVVADHLADRLFAPTAASIANLAREGIPAEQVEMVGDVMYDAAIFYREKARRTSRILEELNLRPAGYILATIHRAENTDDPSLLKIIMEGMSLAARTMPVVLPLHPRTRQALKRFGLEQAMVAGQSSLRIIAPVGYLDMTRLETQAAMIATDSGGVQKEAYFHRVPCVTLRQETEWVELVETGWNRLCPPVSAEGLGRTVVEAIGSKGAGVSLYGEGQAALRIVESLARMARAQKPS